MTIGELGRMFNSEWRPVQCRLKVVPMEGWTRSMWWEETGVPWVNPSPNMRNPTQAVLYPCVGLLEGANLSVGRGTDEPFELFGAPWIDGKALADALSADGLAGIQFTPFSFVPAASKFSGETCGGVHFAVVDRDAFPPVEAAMWMLGSLYDLFGEAGNAAGGESRRLSASTLEKLRGAVRWQDVPSTWKDDVESFAAQRSSYILYPR